MRTLISLAVVFLVSCIPMSIGTGMVGVESNNSISQEDMDLAYEWAAEDIAFYLDKELDGKGYYIVAIFSNKTVHVGTVYSRALDEYATIMNEWANMTIMERVGNIIAWEVSL